MQFPPRKESLRDIFTCSCYYFPEVISMRDIGKNIRDLRQAKNMTQDTLAEMLYVTRQTVSNYETGRTRPDVEMVCKIAEVLETDANTILYGIPAPPERKADIRKLLIAACALLVFLPLYIWLGNITEWYRQRWYIVWPKMLMSIFLTPPLFLLLGWTMMQAIGTFTKLSPIGNKIVRWVILGYCAFYLAVLLPFTATIFLELRLPSFLNQLAYGLLGVLPGKLSVLEPSMIFLFLGILLWLFRFPGKQIETA